MIGRNHVLSSLAAWMIAVDHVPLLTTTDSSAALVAQVFGVILGALLPDIDHPNSLLGRHVRFISVPLSRLQGDMPSIYSKFHEIRHSRGITHSIWSIAVVFYVASLLPEWFAGVAFGYVAHLVGDAGTPAGIRLFWPIDTRLRSPVPFRTGGGIEYAITWGLIIYALSLYWPLATRL